MVELVGPGGLLTGLTKTLLETALAAELSEHLGHVKHDRSGRNGGNSCNGTRPKTVLTEPHPMGHQMEGRAQRLRDHLRRPYRPLRKQLTTMIICAEDRTVPRVGRWWRCVCMYPRWVRTGSSGSSTGLRQDDMDTGQR